MAYIRVPIFASVADDSIPTGPQLSAKFSLIGPDGTRVCFNDQNDRDYIGMVTSLTGMDSPEVREQAEDLVEANGGIHGNFYYGRRPIVVSGILLNPLSTDDRNRRMTKLMAASNAMRSDAALQWVLDGGYSQFVSVRRQQPLRIDGAWQKTFQIGLVASDPRIYGTELKEAMAAANASLPVFNAGNAGMHPLITLQGPLTNPVVRNLSNGGVITLTYTLASGESLTVDTLNKTVFDHTGVSRYSAVQFLSTDPEWITVDPGENTLVVQPSAGAGTMTVFSRDAWI